jgi:tetratricopeptide (TPR) repeat protein
VVAAPPRTAETLKAYAEVSRISQGIPSEHVFLSQMLEMVHGTAAAERILLRGLKEPPTNPFLTVYLIDFLRRQGKTDQTSPHRRALARMPLPDDAMLLPKFAGALLKIGELVLAEKAYRKLLERDPDSAEGNANLAGILNSFGKFQEAERYATRATQLQPDFYMGHYTKGWGLGGPKRLPEAVAALRQAVSLGHNDPNPLLLLGIYLHIYRLEPAEEAMARPAPVPRAAAAAHYSRPPLSTRRATGRQEIVSVMLVFVAAAKSVSPE